MRARGKVASSLIAAGRKPWSFRIHPERAGTLYVGVNIWPTLRSMHRYMDAEYGRVPRTHAPCARRSRFGITQRASRCARSRSSRRSICAHDSWVRLFLPTRSSTRRSPTRVVERSTSARPGMSLMRRADIWADAGRPPLRNDSRSPTVTCAVTSSFTRRSWDSIGLGRNDRRREAPPSAARLAEARAPALESTAQIREQHRRTVRRPRVSVWERPAPRQHGSSRLGHPRDAVRRGIHHPLWPAI
jgi:hypothetical protein